MPHARYRDEKKLRYKENNTETVLKKGQGLSSKTKAHL